MPAEILSQSGSVADDSVLFRDGLAHLWNHAGHDLLEPVGDGRVAGARRARAAPTSP